MTLSVFSVVKDPFVPLGTPDRLAMKRWILFGSFLGRRRPPPRLTMVRIGNCLHMSPETYDLLRREYSR